MAHKLFNLVPSSLASFDQNIDWPSVQKQLHLPLPADYKSLCDMYGYGIWADWLVLLFPNAPCTSYDLLSMPQEILKAESEFQRTEPLNPYGDAFQFKLFASTTGLYPFAVTTDMHTLYWDFDERFAVKSIVVIDNRDTLYSVHPPAIYDLIYKYLMSNLNDTVLPSRVVDPNSYFVSWPVSKSI
jgi:hypothetical protein